MLEVYLALGTVPEVDGLGDFIEQHLRCLHIGDDGGTGLGFLIALGFVVRHLPAFSAPLWVLLCRSSGRSLPTPDSNSTLGSFDGGRPYNPYW